MGCGGSKTENTSTQHPQQGVMRSGSRGSQYKIQDPADSVPRDTAVIPREEKIEQQPQVNPLPEIEKKDESLTRSENPLLSAPPDPVSYSYSEPRVSSKKKLSPIEQQILYETQNDNQEENESDSDNESEQGQQETSPKRRGKGQGGEKDKKKRDEKKALKKKRKKEEKEAKKAKKALIQDAEMRAEVEERAKEEERQRRAQMQRSMSISASREEEEEEDLNPLLRLKKQQQRQRQREEEEKAREEEEKAREQEMVRQRELQRQLQVLEDQEKKKRKQAEEEEQMKQMMRMNKKAEEKAARSAPERSVSMTQAEQLKADQYRKETNKILGEKVELLGDMGLLMDSEDLEEVSEPVPSSTGLITNADWRGVKVVIKNLPGEYLSSRRLFKEVDVATSFRHENILPILGICFSPPFLCSPCIPRGTLADVLYGPNAKEILWPTKAAFIGNIISGLSAMHASKVPHGSLTTTHLFVDRDWTILIGGWATKARLGVIASGTSVVPPTLSDFSSVAHLPYEALSASPRTPIHPTLEGDVWAMGVVIWQIVMQKEPFKDLPTQAIVDMVVNRKETLPFSTPLPSNSPAELVEICEDCWDPDPEERPTLDEIKKRIAALPK